MGRLKSYQIFYMPYLFLAKEAKIEIGNIIIWPFENLKFRKKYIESRALRVKIKKLLNTNVSFDNKPIKGIGVITINGKTYDNFNDDERLHVSEIRTILFLGGISSNLTLPNSSLICTADNFELVQQNFILEDDSIGFGSGAIINIIDSGYKLSKFKTYQPKFLPKLFKLHLDVLLILNIYKLKKSHKRIFNRIIQSSEIFIHAYKNSHDVSWDSRILLQMQSNEVLLDLGKDGRMDFKNEIESLCNDVSETHVRFLSHKDKKNRKVYEIRSKKVFWAQKFYMLRNKIIHGESFRKLLLYGNQRNFNLATMFFILCIKRILNRTFKKTIFLDKISWDKVKKQFLYKKCFW